ncbi:uncharacterized protein EV420DRAFT_1640962 [Desarmillaria tabescens]|uniref:Uncharacterized protein n=1 Tax=Armillaria tabescens TaxID=1929756 RepID=A0AA39KFU8_ARMTA|nr:uncharacterized protein EV420DRAFT_1640962 [Desarmillaria tabescens]KAK0460417.1 hypothetical protein EV420DRAFT_1640962 [Desarmillaria tabescens]
MSTSSIQYLIFIRSLLHATPTTTTASSTITSLTLSTRDFSPVIICRGGQRVAVPKFIFRDADNIAILELTFDKILQSSYKTKGLRGHEGTIVYIPLKYLPNLLPYVTSVEFDVRKGSHPFIGLFFLLIVAVMVVSVSNGYPITHLPLHLFQLIVTVMYHICHLVVLWLVNSIEATGLFDLNEGIRV